MCQAGFPPPSASSIWSRHRVPPLPCCVIHASLFSPLKEVLIGFQIHLDFCVLCSCGPGPCSAGRNVPPGEELVLELMCPPLCTCHMCHLHGFNFAPTCSRGQGQVWTTYLLPLQGESDRCLGSWGLEECQLQRNGPKAGFWFPG